MTGPYSIIKTEALGEEYFKITGPGDNGTGLLTNLKNEDLAINVCHLANVAYKKGFEDKDLQSPINEGAD